MNLRLLSLYGDLRRVPRLAGLRRYGVPPGGPFDTESALLAAALAGSPPDALLELAFGTATFLVEEAGALALVGGGWGERVAPGAGEVLSVAPRGGARVVLAAPGGFARGGLGADPDASLRVAPGDALRSPSADLRPLRLARVPGGPIRVVPGPQRGLFPDPPPRLVVDTRLDRRGVRLVGAPGHAHDLPSEPCVPGVVQWTPGGELIVLGPDGPTIGGYPKPFAILPCDLARVAQLVPGRSVALVEVGLEEGREIQTLSERALALRLARLRIALGAVR